LGQLPSDLKEARRYRTRSDPFEKDWTEIEAKLAAAPELEAKAIFGWLCERDGMDNIACSKNGMSALYRVA
jgi:hypothetical protein